MEILWTPFSLYIQNKKVFVIKIIFNDLIATILLDPPSTLLKASNWEHFIWVIFFLILWKKYLKYFIETYKITSNYICYIFT